MSEQARTDGEVEVRVLNGSQAAQLEDGLKAVFAQAFAEPPYDEGGPDDVDRAFRRFRSQTRKADDLADVAFGPGDQVVGMAYGYPLAATTRWWETPSSHPPCRTPAPRGRAPDLRTVRARRPADLAAPGHRHTAAHRADGGGDQ